MNNNNNNNLKVEELIKTYLLNHGYQSAANAMELEMKKERQQQQQNNNFLSSINSSFTSSSSSISSSSNINSNNSNSNSNYSVNDISNFVLELCSKEMKEQVKLEDYKIFHEWVISSIDVVKHELLAIRFPIFVHSYVTLRKQKKIEANELLAYGSPDFMGDYAEEIRALTCYTDCDLRNASSLFMQYVLQKQFKLKMSSICFNLLKNFFLQNNMFAFLNMISSGSIIITVFESNGTPVAPSFAILDQYHRIIPDTGNSLPLIKWGVHGKTPIRITGDANEKEIFPDSRDFYFTNIMDNLILPTKILRGDTTSINTPILPPSGISRQSSYGSNLNMYSSLSSTTSGSNSNNSNLNSVLEPNVVFATLLNTSGTMTCLHMTKDCQQIASGYTDSLIRVWSSDPELENVCIRDETYDDNQSGYTTTSGGGNLTTVLPRALLTSFNNNSSNNNNSNSNNINNNRYTPSSISTSRQQFSRTNNSSTSSTSTSTSFPYNLELRGHTKRVYSVCQEEYLSTGRIIVSSSADETIRLWDTHLGQSVAKYYSGEGITWAVNFSPVGYYFLGANQTRTASVYCTERPSALRVYRGHSSDVTCCAWHPNLAYFATGSDDRTARLWDIRAKPEAVRCFSPLAPYTTNINNTILSSFITSLSPVTCVQCSPCGSILGVGYEDGVIVTWDIPQSKITSILIPDNEIQVKKKRKRNNNNNSQNGHDNNGNNNGNNNNQSSLSTNNHNNTLSSINNPTLEINTNSPSINSGKYCPVYSMVFNQDSNVIISGNSKGAINVYNISSVNYHQILYNQQKSFLNSPLLREIEPVIISPHHSFLTKHTPVYSLGIGTNNLIYGGGPLSLPTYM